MSRLGASLEAREELQVLASGQIRIDQRVVAEVAERRIDELERGDVTPIPLEEVLREAQARLSRS